MELAEWGWASQALLPQLDDNGGWATHGLSLWACAVGWDRALLPQLV
jgi:hypothetical protein